MATTVVPTSFKVLVKMVASAFYGGMCPPLDALPAEERERAQKPQNDTTGLGRVLLAALTERQWVKEDDLASDLNLHPKMVRRALRYLEQEQLLQREHRKETKRQMKKEAAALDQALAPEDEEQLKAHVVSYCAIDYPRLVDSLRYRLETMKRNVKRACENREVVQRYRCTNDMCAAEFSSLDVDKLEMNWESGTFSCSICGSDVDQLIGADSGVGYTGSTAERRAYVARMQEINKVLDDQLRPLRDQLSACVGQTVPDFNTFQVWMTERIIVAANERDMREKAASKPGGGYGGGGGGGWHGGGGGGHGISIDTYDANMQVLVNFEDEPAGASGGGAGASTSAPAAAGPSSSTAAPRSRPGGARGGGGGNAAAAGGAAAATAAGAATERRQRELDTTIAAIKNNPNLSEEERARHIAFHQQLAAQKAAAAAVGRQVAVPWLASKFAQQPGAAAGPGGGGSGAAGEGGGAGDDKRAAATGLMHEGGFKEDFGGSGGAGVKPEPGLVKPEPGVKMEQQQAAAAAAAASGEGGAGGDSSSPPAKRRRGLGEVPEVPVQNLDWVGDAGDLVGGGAAPLAPAPEAVAAPAAAGASAKAAAAAAAAPQQQQAAAEEEDEEEWEDV